MTSAEPPRNIQSVSRGITAGGLTSHTYMSTLAISFFCVEVHLLIGLTTTAPGALRYARTRHTKSSFLDAIFYVDDFAFSQPKIDRTTATGSSFCKEILQSCDTSISQFPKRSLVCTERCRFVAW